MRGQLFIALVGCVEGLKKRGWISGVKHHRQALLAAEFKDRRKTLVVDTQQPPVGPFDREAEVLPELDPYETMVEHALKPLDGGAHEFWLLDIAPIHPANGEKARCRGAPKAICCFEGRIAHLHGDIDDPLDAGRIHNTQGELCIHRIEMVVVVDDRKSRFIDTMHGHRETGGRVKVAEP